MQVVTISHKQVKTLSLELLVENTAKIVVLSHL